jgi:gamma-glutamylcyclotransferase (GGCT)/AIG2-like uncharacterized protein YtfP
MRMLAIGSALREVCDDQAALGLTFIEEARTAPKYRLYSVHDRFAALVEDEGAGVVIVGELVEVPNERLEELLANEPRGVVQAPVELDDGRIVSSAVGDLTELGADARDITDFGGFAAYLRSLRADTAPDASSSSPPS